MLLIEYAVHLDGNIYLADGTLHCDRDFDVETSSGIWCFFTRAITVTYMNPTMPMTQALNMLDRYHLLGSTVACSSWLSATSEFVEDDIFQAKETKKAIEIKPESIYNLHLDTYSIWKSVGLHLYTKICKTDVVDTIVPYGARRGIHSVTAVNVEAGASDSDLGEKARCLGNFVVYVGRE
jgi:hypothetical protein